MTRFLKWNKKLVVRIRPWLPTIAYVVIFLASTRVFFLHDFEVMGHNWDWNFPGTNSLLDRIDIFSRYVWKRQDLGIPAYMTTVFTPATLLLRLLNLFLPVKWVIFSVLLGVTATAFFGFKRLLDFLTRPFAGNYLPATLYAFSPFLFADIIGGSWVQWVSYAFFPVYFRAVAQFVRNRTWTSLLGAAVSATFVLISTQNFVLINFFIICYLGWLVLRRDLPLHVAMRRLGALAGILVAVNLYWIMIQGHAVRELWKTVVLDPAQFGGWAAHAGSKQTLFHILSLTGYWDRNLSFFALPLALRMVFLVAVASGWMAIIYYLFTERRSHVAPGLFWASVLLALILLVKGNNPPFGEFTMDTFRSVTVLRMFRTPQNLMRVPAFLTPLLLALALQFLYDSARRKKLVMVFFGAIVAFWSSGWWYTGDFGARALLAQNRDHLDYYRLAPDIKKIYNQNVRDPLEQRVLFVPTVYSPRYLQSSYQRDAQGGIPEYDLLKHPTFSAERGHSPLADLIDRALCQDAPSFPATFLAFFNVKQVIERFDILPEHTACREKWVQDRVTETLNHTRVLRTEGRQETIRQHHVTTEGFLPLFYLPTTLQMTDAPLEYLPTLLDRTAGNARRAVFLESQNNDLPADLVARSSLHAPGLRASAGAKAEVRFPVNTRYAAGRTFALRRAFSSRDENVVATYDTERNTVRLALEEDALTFNGQSLPRLDLPEIPAELGDLVGMGKRLITVTESMRETVPFAADAQIYSRNETVLQESFETGVAPGEGINCSSGNTAELPLAIRTVPDATDANSPLELSTDGDDTACFRRLYDIALKKDVPYLLSFDYQNVAGGVIKWLFDVGIRDHPQVSTETFTTSDDDWHSYTYLVQPGVDTTFSQLFLYAPQSSNRRPNVSRFDNFRLERVTPTRSIPLLGDVSSGTGDHWSPAVLDGLHLERDTALESAFRGAEATTNLLADSSFESGPWQSAPADCHGKASGDDVGQSLSPEATDGALALELRAKFNHVACVSKRFSLPIKKARTYKLSFDYFIREGPAAQFSYSTSQERPITVSDEIRAPLGTWHNYETIVTPAEDMDNLQVSFYAPANPQVTTGNAVVRYDNLRLVEWIPTSALQYFLDVEPVTPVRPPLAISFTGINPTKYRVRVHGVSESFPLVFSEAFHPGWKTYPVPRETVPPRIPVGETHFRRLPGSEDVQASPEELADFLKRGWVTPQSRALDFVSKNLQGTIQDNNLPRGHLWDTWFQQPLPGRIHVKANGFANAWWVDLPALCARPGLCRTNADGSIDLELVVEFWPQRLLTLGYGLSGIAWLSLLGSIGWFHRNQRRL